MSTYTPGPWGFERTQGLDGEHWYEVAPIADDELDWDREIACTANGNLANARLIAAAPQMYEALKHAEQYCPCGARPESLNTHPHVSACPIGAAIAKAEGRS